MDGFTNTSSNIAAGVQTPQFENPLDVQAKAMNLKSLGMQQQQLQNQLSETQGVKDAFANNVSTDANGNSTINRQGVLADLYKSAPTQAINFQQTFQNQDLDKLDKVAKAAKTLAWSISDDNSYQQAKQQAQALGLPNAEKLPDQYNPTFVQHWQLATLDGDKQLQAAKDARDAQLKQQEFGFKQQEFSQRQQGINMQRDQMNNDRLDKRFDLMKKDLDPDAARAGNFGQASAKILQADHLQALAQQFPDGNLPSAQLEELAMGGANMISGSNGAAQAQIKGILPSSAYGDVNKTLAWLENDPRGTGQQAYVKMIGDSVARQKEVSQQQLNQIRSSRLSNYAQLQQRDPDRFNNMLQSYGMDPANMQGGRYIAPAAASNSSSAGGAPAQGSIYKDPNSGATYKVVGDHWVQQ